MQEVQGMVVHATTFASPRLKRLHRLISACSMYFCRSERDAQNPSGAENPGKRPLYAVPMTRLSLSSAAAPTLRKGSSDLSAATCASAITYCGIESRLMPLYYSTSLPLQAKTVHRARFARLSVLLRIFCSTRGLLLCYKMQEV